MKSSLSPGRDLAIKEVRINPERYTTDQLPAETDLLELFVVGKKRIKRSMSEQQFVGFEPSPPPSVSWHKAQAEVRKEEREKKCYHYVLKQRIDTIYTHQLALMTHHQPGLGWSREPQMAVL